MSHEEEIRRRNAEMNTPDAWQRRWQIEREHNERLEKQASMVRTGVQSLRAKAIKDYASVHHASNGATRQLIHSGKVQALNDVLELLDHIDSDL